MDNWKAKRRILCHTLAQTFTKQTTNLNMGSSFQNKCICTHQSSKNNFNTVLEICHNLGICPSENAQKISLWVKIHNKIQDGLQSADYREFNNVMD